MRTTPPLLAIALLLASPGLGAGEAPVDEAAPSQPGAAQDAFPDDGLSAEAIHERYIAARTRESFQKLRVVSRDPGGSEQLSRFDLLVQDARDDEGKPTRGVRWRTRIDVDDPFDLRHTRYLIIEKHPGPNDEFVYQPSARRVRRVNLSKTSFLGTDYTFGDFAVRDYEEAVHTRHPDEEVDGQPVFVVETRVNGNTEEVDYPRTIVYLEKQHYLPLRTRSWDDADVEVKEMRAPADGIREFDGIWVATESTVRDLLQDTSSTLYVDEVDPKPKFKGGTFTSGRLSRGK